MKIRLLILFFQVLANLAYGCSCADRTIDEMVDKSPTVYEGVVEAVLPNLWEVDYSLSPEDFNNQTTDDKFGDNVKVKILRSWKGLENQTTIQVRQLSGNCNIRFEVGKSYLFFCSWAGKNHETNVCHGTRPMEETDSQLLTVLGSSKIHSTDNSIAILAAIIATITLLFLGWLGIKKTTATNKS